MLDATPVGAVEMAGNRNVLLQAATVSGQFTIIRRRSNFHFMSLLYDDLRFEFSAFTAKYFEQTIVKVHFYISFSDGEQDLFKIIFGNLLPQCHYDDHFGSTGNV